MQISAESEGLKGEPSNRIIECTPHKTQEFQERDSNRSFKIEKKVQGGLGGSFQETLGADPAVTPSERVIRSPEEMLQITVEPGYSWVAEFERKPVSLGGKRVSPASPFHRCEN